MMSYELALKLKEAGFPGIELTDHEDCDYHQVEFIDGVFYHIPSLSELIEACGGVFDKLWEEKTLEEKWFATGNVMPGFIGKGKTPEEAVAELWLASF